MKGSTHAQEEGGAWKDAKAGLEGEDLNSSPVAVIAATSVVAPAHSVPRRTPRSPRPRRKHWLATSRCVAIAKSVEGE